MKPNFRLLWDSAYAWLEVPLDLYKKHKIVSPQMLSKLSPTRTHVYLIEDDANLFLLGYLDALGISVPNRAVATLRTLNHSVVEIQETCHGTISVIRLYPTLRKSKGAHHG